MTEPHFIEAQRTPVPHEEFAEAMVAAWWLLFAVEPARTSIALLVAHWALETGHGKAMWNHNVGNAKGRVGDGRSWTYFACNEVLSPEHALALVKAAGVRTEPVDAAGNIVPPGSPDVVITGATSSGALIVWFYPDHAACRFRAFDTLEEGAVDYLALVSKRFASAWLYVLAGDPDAFVRSLKAAKYFTADEGLYALAVRQLHRQFSGLAFSTARPAPPADTITEADRARTTSLVATTLRELTQATIDEADGPDEPDEV